MKQIEFEGVVAALPIKLLSFTKGPIHNTYASTGGTYSVKIGNTYINFILQGCSTGCGLGLFAGFTGCTDAINANLDLFKISLKAEAKKIGHHCLIATLGDLYTNRVIPTNPPTVYQELLKSLGFKEVFEYINLCHMNSYKQKIYACVVSDIK